MFNKIITIQHQAIRDGKYLARHMLVLGNVHHIKIENFDIFSWRNFSARSSCYIINWYGYPRGSHEKYLKEIVSPVFEIRHWMLNVAHVTNDVKWVGRGCMTAIFFWTILWAILTAVWEFYMLNVKYWRIFCDVISLSNINCGIGVLHVKRQILTYFLWRNFSARSSFYCFSW